MTGSTGRDLVGLSPHVGGAPPRGLPWGCRPETCAEAVNEQWGGRPEREPGGQGKEGREEEEEEEGERGENIEGTQTLRPTRQGAKHNSPF